ncbi:amino-acid N-acetyltransferase [Deltaproteobacteria bacterium TL4]
MSQQQSLKEYLEFIHNLRGALPYLEEYHGETFVILLNGDTLQRHLAGILDDLVLLHRVGIKIILVHGANPQIQELLTFHKKEVTIKNQRWIVEEPLLSIFQQAIASINWELMTKLSGYGSGVFPFSSHFVQAEKHIFSDITKDHFTGTVRDINTKALQEATDRHYLPIISPLAIGEKGRLWIVDPNQVALEIAVRLRVRKFIILTASSPPEATGLMQIHEITTKEMKSWLAQHPSLEDDLQLSLQALIEACERGVERCHFLDSAVDGTLLAEILTTQGVGTMITNSPYTQFRAAQLSDVHMISELLGQPDFAKTLVRRDTLYIGQHIDNFLLLCMDEELIGCCELIHFETSQTLEIACLAVRHAHRNKGVGRQLVQMAMNHAKKVHCKMVYALSNNPNVFLRVGFKEIPPEQLPEEKRVNYDSKHSKVYQKLLE